MYTLLTVLPQSGPRKKPQFSIVAKVQLFTVAKMQLFIVSFLILSAAYLLHPTQRRSRKKSVMVDLDINKVGFDQEKFFNVVEKSL